MRGNEVGPQRNRAQQTRDRRIAVARALLELSPCVLDDGIVGIRAQRGLCVRAGGCRVARSIGARRQNQMRGRRQLRVRSRHQRRAKLSRAGEISGGQPRARDGERRFEACHPSLRWPS
jgi:hypothetical protein